jgi:hypothetical protein
MPKGYDSKIELGPYIDEASAVARGTALFNEAQKQHSLYKGHLKSLSVGMPPESSFAEQANEASTELQKFIENTDEKYYPAFIRKLTQDLVSKLIGHAEKLDKLKTSSSFARASMSDTLVQVPYTEALVYQAYAKKRYGIELVLAPNQGIWEVLAQDRKQWNTLLNNPIFLSDKKTKTVEATKAATPAALIRMSRGAPVNTGTATTAASAPAAAAPAPTSTAVVSNVKK